MSAPKLFLAYNEFWAPLPEVPAGAGLRLTTDRNCLDDVDAVLFHLPNLNVNTLPARRQNQFWIAWYMESEVYYPRLNDPKFMNLFDIVASHHLTADIWLPYVGQQFLARWYPGFRNKEAGVVYVQSNHWDRAGRRDYVARLMRRVKIDSYGRSLNNRALVGDNGDESKLDLIARYKFTIAFENSIALDYVTEKFFQPLCVGSVPIYRGAPNVRSLAPATDCYIDANNFDSPEHLAAYLNHLLVTPREYEAYLAWRTRDFAPGFKAALEYSLISPWQRLSTIINLRRNKTTTAACKGSKR